MEIHSERWARVLAYAQGRFRGEVGEVLDDPSFLAHPDEGWAGPPYTDYLGMMRQRGDDVELSFDAIVATEGTPFEQKRLRKMLGMEDVS